jgi:hypothetical protein
MGESSDNALPFNKACDEMSYSADEGWAGRWYLALMRGIENAHKINAGEPDGKKPIGRSKCERLFYKTFWKELSVGRVNCYWPSSVESILVPSPEVLMTMFAVSRLLSLDTTRIVRKRPTFFSTVACIRYVATGPLLNNDKGGN